MDFRRELAHGRYSYSFFFRVSSYQEIMMYGRSSRGGFRAVAVFLGIYAYFVIIIGCMYMYTYP